MTQYQVMTYRLDLPEGSVGMGQIIPLPDGWTPLAAARQGQRIVVLCYQQIGGTPPAGGAPVLTSLTPSTLLAGGVPATIDVVGSEFDTSCAIQADGVPRATFFIDPTHLQYTSRPDLATPGVVQITVEGDGGTSNALPFTFA